MTPAPDREPVHPDFVTLPDLIRRRAAAAPGHTALVLDDRRLTYAEFDALIDRVAAALQRDGVVSGDSLAICAASSIEYVLTFMGGLRAGVAIAPLAPNSTAEVTAALVADSGAKRFFLDAPVHELLGPVIAGVAAPLVALDGSPAGTAFEAWLAPPGARPQPVEIDPEQTFNIIYSSGTTGLPKGIVHPHRLRYNQLIRHLYYPVEAVTLISTGLYSNTTLVSFLPTLAAGGTVVLMPKFDARRFLDLSQQHRVTHAMLVPVQYKRILRDVADFDRFDLSSYQMKFCTSAPFAADLKRDAITRWPGGLTEFYGMTEGGGSCVLYAHEHPDKLHTVGRPADGHDIRVINDAGEELPPGEPGEIIGSSPVIMREYLNQPGKTAETIWRHPSGKVFVRTGDIGRFDADGFLTLMDRKKDMIISGGFNIYPSDLEEALLKHPAVLEAAVVAAPSEDWGETPAAFVALRPGHSADAEEIRSFANARLGKTQRISDVRILDSLPRSHIGKVLKRELRDQYIAAR
ncbi:AMP-binding protein [bacterium]|nr:AMP-binding protein [bacterium]